MHDNDDLAEPDLDTLTRAELAELDGPAATVAGILDEWLHRLHGITSGQHGAGLFLDLLAAEGWRVERIQVPPWPFATPAGPVTVRYWPVAPSPQEAEAAKRAVLETAAELVREQQTAGLPSVTVDERVPPGVIALASGSHVIAYRQDTGRAAEMRRDEHGQWSQPQPVDDQQAPTVEVTTSEPDAVLYFTCQNRHPLAARTTTTTENGVRRAVHHEVVCPACEADGITEVRLPDLDDEADDD